jgi:tetratricopeptide (TPR) repeat protein
MITPSPQDLLARARSEYTSDPDRAIATYRSLLRGEPSPPWSLGALDLAYHEYGQARYAEATELTKFILNAPAESVDASARAAAAVLHCDACETLDVEIDEQMLVQGIEDALRLGDPRVAASGLMQLSRRQVSRGERAEAKSTAQRAMDLYHAADAVPAAARALMRLAQLAIEDGQLDEARGHVDRAIGWLEQAPLAGTGARILERRLRELRERIGAR